MLLAAAATLGASAAAAKDNEPIMGDKGATILGPRNPPRESQNPDILRPPATDHGALPNLRFSLKARDGGWSREVTQRELEISKTMAGVNMRLKSGGVRELHWHKQAEWSFMLAGNARITAVDNDGLNFVADVGPGDLWYFPGGIPHSIQGLPDEGCEFLLAFPDGEFSEDSTFAISDLLAHTPRDVLAKDLSVPAESLGQIPKEELFIFQAEPPPSLHEDTVPDPLRKHGLQIDGSNSGLLARRTRAHRRHPQFSYLDRDCRRPCLGRSRPHARDPLAPECRLNGSTTSPARRA
jgi:oxalate decarboxylase